MRTLAARLDAALRALFVVYCHAHSSTTPPRSAWTWRSFVREQRRILDTPVGLLPQITDWGGPVGKDKPLHAPLGAYANKGYVSPLDGEVPAPRRRAGGSRVKSNNRGGSDARRV